MIILSSALLLLTNSWSSSFLRVRKTQHQFEVASLLQRKMTEIELEYRGKPLSEIPEEKSEDFGEKYPQYSWKLESKKLEVPDIASTLSAKEGGVDQFTMTVIKQLTEGISKMVKEVKLTVIFKPSKGDPLEYNVTTYFVDYDQDFPMGMPTGQ